jgi:hypothetical protein
MQEKVDYIEELDKHKVYVESLKMEMIPYNEAKRLFTLLLSDTFTTLVEDVNKAMNEYLTEIQNLTDEKNIH